MCYKWAVGVRLEGLLELQLQSLPAPAATLNAKLILRMDDVPIVPLVFWPIEIQMFDGNGVVAGPAPLIFCSDTERMRTILEEEAEDFGMELNSFMKR
jgi:hypothetical protein